MHQRRKRQHFKFGRSGPLTQKEVAGWIVLLLILGWVMNSQCSGIISLPVTIEGRVQ